MNDGGLRRPDGEIDDSGKKIKIKSENEGKVKPVAPLYGNIFLFD